jgi:hypothetical protein
VHTSGPDGSAPQRAAGGVGSDGGFDRVLLALAGHERPPTGPVGLGSADLDLGAVQAQSDAFGGAVGDHVGQGAQASPDWVANPRLASSGRTCRIAAETVERSTWYSTARAVCGIPKAQPGQSDQDPVAELERLASPGPGLAPPVAAAPVVQAALPLGVPRAGQSEQHD